LSASPGFAHLNSTLIMTGESDVLGQTFKPVSVFVRVRPLVAAEEGFEILPGMMPPNADGEVTATALSLGKSSVSGFTGVIGPDANNQAVFEHCLRSRLRTVLQGGSTSFFCYGYTGGGKTHTVIGYGAEQGLYFHATKHLLSELHRAVGQEGLFLHATACEVYNDTVFDLLGAEKIECDLLKDESGQLQVRRKEAEKTKIESDASDLLDQLSAEQRKEMLDAKDQFDERGVPSRFNGSIHSSIVRRSEGLRSLSIFAPEDLEGISRTYVQQRSAGASSQHEQSSRSHAILRVEVVNAALLEARQAFDEAQAQVPPLKNSLDNLTNVACKLLFYGQRSALMTSEPPSTSQGRVDDLMERLAESDELIWNPVDPEGDHWVVSGYENGLQLEGFPDEAKSLEAWAEHLGVPKLHCHSIFAKKQFHSPGEWKSKHAELCAEKDRLQAALVLADAEVKRAGAAVVELIASGPASLGGSLVLVDLAGADYDHRTGAQQKESAAINKSLLALKECLRTIAKGGSQRPKFRDSNLTRLMEDSLAPGVASSRKCRDSTSVMLVNVSPAAQLEKRTLNALRYGELFAKSSSAAAVSKVRVPVRRVVGDTAAASKKTVSPAM